MGKSDFTRWKMGLKAVSGPCVYVVVLLLVGAFLYLLSIECNLQIHGIQVVVGAR